MRVTRIIALLFLLISAAGFYSLYNYLNNGLEPQTLQATEESMVDQVHLLSAVLENNISNGEIDPEILISAFDKAKTHRFNAIIYKMHKREIGTNFYVTNSKGIVLYDSAHPERIGMNFYPFHDVIHTFQGKYGARSTRADEDLPHSSVMYVGAPIIHQDKIIGTVSLYKPQTDVLPFIEGRRRWIIISLCLIGFGITAFTFAVFFWLFRPLGMLIDYARAITRGDRPAYPKLGRGREVNTLGTALRNMRAALEGRNYMENYIRMLTHELKSPLSAIKGASELLNEDMPREHREKFLANIHAETERSQRIIDGLLQLSKLESLDQLDTNEHLELLPIIKEVLNDLNSLIEQHQLNIQLQINQRHTVHGDHMSIIAALSNIITNAIQFSPTGSTITVESISTDKHIELRVTDNGPGIPDYAQNRVFEHFYSLARPGTDKKSSGLGLAFVKEVANLHNGYATLENAKAGGTIVTLALKK